MRKCWNFPEKIYLLVSFDATRWEKPIFLWVLYVLFIHQAHTHTAGGDCRAPTGEKNKSGVVESLQVKKRSGPTFLTSFTFHSTAAFVAWLSIWHLYRRRNLFSHFLFSPDFVFLLSVFFFIGFVAGEKGNVGSRSDRKHNGGYLCVCAITTF